MALNKYVLLLLIALLFGGLKIVPDSVSVGIYDFVALFAAIISIKKFNYIYRHARTAFLILISIALIQFSPLVASTLSSNPPQIIRFLFALRILEYIIFIPIIYFASKKISINHIYTMSLVGAIITPLVFLVNGHRWGVFQYSWELGAIYSLVFVFFLANGGVQLSNFKRIIILLISAVIVLYTNQRSPILAILFCLSAYGWNRRGFSTRASLLILLSIFIFGVFATENRLSNSFSEFEYKKIINVVEAGLQYAALSPSYDSFVYEDRSLLTEDGSDDLSFHLRIRKWAYAFVHMQPLEFVIGLGPGYFGGAADSSLLRFFFETGFIGSALWFGLFIYLFKYHKNFRLLLFSMIINGVFIDVFYSARTLLVFTLLLFLLSRDAFISNRNSVNPRS